MVAQTPTATPTVVLQARHIRELHLRILINRQQRRPRAQELIRRLPVLILVRDSSMADLSSILIVSTINPALQTRVVPDTASQLISLSKILDLHRRIMARVLRAQAAMAMAQVINRVATVVRRTTIKVVTTTRILRDNTTSPLVHSTSLNSQATINLYPQADFLPNKAHTEAARSLTPTLLMEGRHKVRIRTNRTKLILVSLRITRVLVILAHRKATTVGSNISHSRPIPVGDEELTLDLMSFLSWRHRRF